MGVEPTKETAFTLGCVSRASTASRPPWTRLSTPLGRPACSSNSATLMARERHLLARLEDEGVAAGDGDGIHPERHHGREVEGRDAGADAERLADGLAVNAAGDVLQRLAHEQGRHAAGELDHLDAALHVAARLDEGLAVLAGVAADQLIEVLLQQRLEAEEDAGAVGRRRFPPGRGRRPRRPRPRHRHVWRCRGASRR